MIPLKKSYFPDKFGAKLSLYVYLFTHHVPKSKSWRFLQKCLMLPWHKAWPGKVKFVSKNHKLVHFKNILSISPSFNVFQIRKLVKLRKTYKTNKSKLFNSTLGRVAHCITKTNIFRICNFFIRIVVQKL